MLTNTQTLKQECERPRFGINANGLRFHKKDVTKSLSIFIVYYLFKRVYTTI